LDSEVGDGDTGDGKNLDIINNKLVDINQKFRYHKPKI